MKLLGVFHTGISCCWFYISPVIPPYIPMFSYGLIYIYIHTHILIDSSDIPTFQGASPHFLSPLRWGPRSINSSRRIPMAWWVPSRHHSSILGDIRLGVAIYKKGYSFIVGLIAVGVLPVARLCRTSGACRNAMNNLLSGPGLTIFWFYLCCFPRQWWDLWLDRDDWQMRRGNLKGLFPRAMTPGVDGFEIQLTWDEFSRMRKRFDWPATLFAIHSACYRLASAASGKLPVLTEIGRSHFYDLALAVLELFSCWLASLACCLFVVDHQQPSVAKGERGFATGILGCGRLLGRSCYGAQTMASSRAIFPI